MKSPDLLEVYRAELDTHGWQSDDAQLRMLTSLQRLTDDLSSQAGATDQGFLGQVMRRFGFNKTPAVKGVYAYGGVGRGKTFVMDLFFSRLPVEQKQRVHFHRFMLGVHKRLHELKSTESPLKIVAGDISATARVLCFDELFVDDITDAMVLAGLFQRLIENGVALVFTSNARVDDLYRDGLQRERFLPAIELIKQHCEVLNIDGGTDYRLRALESAGTYLCPHNDQNENRLRELFFQLAAEIEPSTRPLIVLGREIPVIMECEGVCWFHFTDLCEGFRSKADYAELSRFFHTILISDVPLLGVEGEDSTRRFIELIDEMYDRRVNVIVSAAAIPEDLYRGQRLAHSFERTASRLREFSDPTYMALPHRP